MAASMGGVESHVQAKFTTKQHQYAIPDAPFSLPTSVGPAELSSMVNSILSSEVPELDPVSFEFLINKEFLRTCLDEFLQQRDIPTEAVLEIEYIEKQPAPEPQNSLLHDDWVSSIQALNDYILTGCYDNALRLWNTEGDQLINIPGHSAPVKCVSWIKNEDDIPVKTFASGSHDETILIWQWNQQTNSVDCVHSCRGHAGSVDCIAVSPCQTKFCSGSWDKMLKLWSTETGGQKIDDTEEAEPSPKKKKTEGDHISTRVPVLTLSGHNEGISSVVWLGDQEVCTASWDHTIRIWHLEQAVQTATLTGAKVFFDIAYSSKNQLLIAASADRHVRLYDPRATDGAVVKSTFSSHNAWVSGVAWSPHSEHQFISGSYDSLLKLWDTRSPKVPMYDLAGHEEKILAVDWTMPHYMMSGGADSHLKIFSNFYRQSKQSS